MLYHLGLRSNLARRARTPRGSTDSWWLRWFPLGGMQAGCQAKRRMAFSSSPWSVAVELIAQTLLATSGEPVATSTAATRWSFLVTNRTSLGETRPLRLVVLLLTSSSLFGVRRFPGLLPLMRTHGSAAGWSLDIKEHCWLAGWCRGAKFGGTRGATGS